MPTFSYLYSCPYLLLWLWLLFLYSKTKKCHNNNKRKRYEKIAVIIVVLFIGLRGFVYSDFTNYYVFFESLPDVYNLTTFSYEPGFVIYSSIIKTIFPNYFIWILINTLVDFYFFVLVFRRYDTSLILILCFFIAYQGLGIEFNLLRNVKAIILFMYSIKFIEERKIIPFILCNLLGVTFHYSALIYLPMYYLLNIEISNKLKWIIIFTSASTFLLGYSISFWLLNHLPLDGEMDLVKKVLVYTNDTSSYKLSFGFFERTFNICLLTYYYNRLNSVISNFKILYNCALAFYLLFMLFADVLVFVERFPVLFVFSYWIIFSHLFSKNIIGSKYKPLLILLLFFSFFRIAKENNHLLAKYENVLFGITDYKTRAKHAEIVLNEFTY
ncbi:MAG: EpsG family protein [Bacteroides sp.]|nr:EpsG family protein [Bacteroides sp.]